MVFLLKHRHKVLFGFFGSILAGLNIGSQYLLKEKLNIEAGLTNVYVTLVLYVLQFVLNAVFTWGDRQVSLKKNLWRAGKYIPIKAVLWTVNTGLDLWLLEKGWHYQAANITTILAIMVINYFVFDKVIFIKK